MLDFVCYVKPEYQVNWHHRVLCDHLDRFVAGDIQNLMVFMPPQHGKSELVSRKLPAFLFGQQPDAKVIAASYAAELIQSMNRDVQRTIDSPEYQRLFPDTKLNSANVRTVAGGYLRNNDIFEIVGKGGQYRCAGVGGGLTGFPADYGIIDDPYKDYKEATSPTIRKAVQEWYTSVFLSRTHKGTRKLLTLTRWHEADLAGWLLDTEPNEWTVLILPALCEQPDAPNEIRQMGEALWEDKFPRDLLLKRKHLNPHQFAALYQQTPRPREGNMFPRDAVQIVDVAPIEAARVRRWDLAGTDNDGARTAGVLMAMDVHGILYIEDVEKFQKAQAGRDAHIKRIADQDARNYHNTVEIIVPQDPGSAGKDVANALIKLLVGYPVKAVRESGDKVQRADPFASQWQAGNVRLVRGDWNDDFLDELEAFPFGAFKDQVDASAGALSELALSFGEQETIVTYDDHYTISRY